MTDLSGLKVGDKVIVFHGGAAVRTVSKVGKMHVTVYGQKYRMTGWAVGSGPWTSHYVEPFTDEKWAAIKQKGSDNRSRSRLEDYQTWRKLPIETIREVCALLDSKGV